MECGLGVVGHCVNPLVTMLYRSVRCSPDAVSDRLPANEPEEDGSSAWAPVAHIGDLHGVPGS